MSRPSSTAPPSRRAKRLLKIDQRRPHLRDRRHPARRLPGLQRAQPLPLPDPPAAAPAPPPPDRLPWPRQPGTNSPVSRCAKPNRAATARAMVPLPAAAGPSIATVKITDAALLTGQISSGGSGGQEAPLPRPPHLPYPRPKGQSAERVPMGTGSPRPLGAAHRRDDRDRLRTHPRLLDRPDGLHPRLSSARPKGSPASPAPKARR